MDHWALAIERNRQRLLAVVGSMFALLGVAVGGSVPRMDRATHRALKRVLIPAQSAVLRLIVMVARDMAAAIRTLPASRSRARGGADRVATGARRPLIALWDRRKSFKPRLPRRIPPRIIVIGVDEPVFQPRRPPPSDTDPFDGRPLCRRLLALHGALADLPGQARRLARHRARQALRRARGLKARPASPLRPGFPPGWRSRGRAAVHEILHECEAMARRAEHERHLAARATGPP